MGKLACKQSPCFFESQRLKLGRTVRCLLQRGSEDPFSGEHHEVQAKPRGRSAAGVFARLASSLV